ncbi:MAG: hemerythrin family protein [Spirochaetales bacterium]|nr:bacteriohemerythrin [Exilispira sp.]NMC67080.1 hemerythrin family protein [Spirochaetales bacterium]
MPLVLWDDSFSVNVKEIDSQHQALFDLINKLYEAMKKGQGKEVLPKIIDELFLYVEKHFSTEEKYFDRFNYPETENHKLEHYSFLKKVSEFKKSYENSEIALTIDVITFLQTWLTNHIKISDKKYSQFFNENGLK